MRNTKLLQKKLERRDVFIAMMSERMGKVTEWTIVALPWGKLTVRCGKSWENDRFRWWLFSTSITLSLPYRYFTMIVVRTLNFDHQIWSCLKIVVGNPNSMVENIWRFPCRHGGTPKSSFFVGNFPGKPSSYRVPTFSGNLHMVSYQSLAIIQG